MPETVTFDQVRRLLDEGAQLVEVLPRREYEEQHLPGASSIPLKQLDMTTVAGLKRDTAVIVYCWDSI
jgi:rhodanese-related sulfurtransferase